MHVYVYWGRRGHRHSAHSDTQTQTNRHRHPPTHLTLCRLVLSLAASPPFTHPHTLCRSVLSTRITRSWLARSRGTLVPFLKTCVMQLRTCSMEPEMMYMSCEGGGARDLDPA